MIKKKEFLRLQSQKFSKFSPDAEICKKLLGFLAFQNQKKILACGAEKMKIVQKICVTPK